MSNLIPFLLAAVDGFDPLEETPLPPNHGTSTLFSSHLRDILLVVGAAAIMALILFLWAYLTRKDRQRHAATNRGTRLISRPEKHQSSGSGKRKRIRKRRREHPDNLPRNPTLAEAGGLPPLRPEPPEPESDASTSVPPQTQPQ